MKVLKQNQDYDVIIIGAGLVGTSLAVALAQHNLRIAILETHLPSSLTQATTDNRPLTLNYASQQILQSLNIWPALAAQASAITQVVVSEQGRFGKLRFNAQDFRLPALGYVVPMALLQQQLYQSAAAAAEVSMLCIDQLTAIEHSAQGVSVSFNLASGSQTLQAGLLVGADGSQSTTRRLSGIKTRDHNCNELALITNITLKQAHQHRAYERFCNDGVLALLPLFHANQMRLVWTLTLNQWQQVQSWSNQEFNDFLNTRFAGYLGPLVADPNYQTIPLQTSIAEQQILPGLVLLGNAAHTLYPLAAQGFNLGLKDAATLSTVLAQARRDQHALGDLSVLQRYINWRQPQQRWISNATLSISQLFGLQLPLLGSCRSLGLLLTDLCTPLKQRIGKRLLGCNS